MRRELDDEIRRAVGADVADAVRFVRRLEDEATGLDNVGFVALQRRQRAFLDDHQLLVRVVMRRMRRLAGIERGDVDFQIRERGRGRVANRAALTHLRRDDLEVGPVEDG